MLQLHYFFYKFDMICFTFVHIGLMKSYLDDPITHRKAQEVKSVISGEYEPCFTVPLLESDFNQVQEIWF